MDSVRLLAWYYGATVLFLALDVAFGVNVRVAFLDPWPAARFAYYGFCVACFALLVWRPSWSTGIGTAESMVVLVALILGMAVRVMVPNDAIFEENVAIVTYQEVINFLLAGFFAYFAWMRGLKQLSRAEKS